MISPRWHKVARDLTSHKIRTALVVLSIAVGVFAIAVVMGGREILLREFDVDFEASIPPSAQFDTTGFDAKLPANIADREDVRDAEGRRRVTVRYSTASIEETATTEGWETLRLWAIPQFGRGGVQKLVREEYAAWPPRPGGVILEKSALQIEDISVGDIINVETSAGKRGKLRVEGFAHDINVVPAQFQDALTGFVSMETLAVLGEPDALNHLSIVLDPTVSRSAASRIAADIRDTDLTAAGVNTLRLEVPEPGSHFLGDIFKAVSLLLLALGIMALALSGFLVVTTVQAILAQQVRQVGIMKAVGGRHVQIAWMYLALVAAYGVLAVAIGLPLGLWAGAWFAEYAAGIMNFRLASDSPPAWVFGLVLFVGLVVPVLAAAFPIHKGTTLPVARALDPAGSGTRFGTGIIDRALGLLRGLPRPVALSLRNTFVRKGRLALTLTTLVLASAVVMGVVTVRASMLQTVEDMGAWWRYDAQVFMARPQRQADLESEAAKVTDVDAVETWFDSQVSLTRPDGSENQETYALGVPVDTEFITPVLVAGRWLEPGGADEVVVNTDVLKDEPYLSVGDIMYVTVRGAERRWRIVGVVTGQLMGSVMFIDREVLQEATGAEGFVTRLLVQTPASDPDSQVRTSRELERRLDEAGLTISGSQTQEAQKQTIANQLGILVTFLVIMAVILAAVGVIGLTGTMTINVLESTREIGVMRSIGASHASIFGIYITEGVVVGLMAWGLGALLSWPLSVWLVDALGTAMGLPLSYAYSWWGVGMWLVLVVLIAAVASLLPAWRASMVSIRDAIAYE
ncbi:MAG: FtsX-like permease family protein [Coriobacteriia bacterium]|nr:FtsX-like permease family protein [Coriobacteriia bacterium]